MKRAFVLSIDIFAAVSLAVVLIIAMSEMVSYETGYININNLKIGEDTLLILDETGSLQTMNSSVIYNDLAKYLSGKECELQISFYNKNLEPYSEMTIKKPSNATVPKNYETAQRAFVVKDGWEVRYYGIAVIKVW